MCFCIPRIPSQYLLVWQRVPFPYDYLDSACKPATPSRLCRIRPLVVPCLTQPMESRHRIVTTLPLSKSVCDWILSGWDSGDFLRPPQLAPDLGRPRTPPLNRGKPGGPESPGPQYAA